MNAKTIIEDRTAEVHYALEKALAAELKALVIRLNAERPESEPWFWPKSWGFEFNYWLTDRVKTIEIYLKYNNNNQVVFVVVAGRDHDVVINDENAGVRVAKAITAVEQLFWETVGHDDPTNESLTAEDFRELVRTMEEELTNLSQRLTKEFGENITSSSSIGTYSAAVSLWPPNSWEDVTVVARWNRADAPASLEVASGKRGGTVYFTDPDPGVRLAKALGHVEMEMRRLNYHEDAKYP